MKKAQGLSLNTIIIAALVIMVLVILALVFTGQIGGFSEDTDGCNAKGGQCREDDCLDNEQPSLFGGTCPEGFQCCMPKITS